MYGWMDIYIYLYTYNMKGSFRDIDCRLNWFVSQEFGIEFHIIKFLLKKMAVQRQYKCFDINNFETLKH